MIRVHSGEWVRYQRPDCLCLQARPSLPLAERLSPHLQARGSPPSRAGKLEGCRAAGHDPLWAPEGLSPGFGLAPPSFGKGPVPPAPPASSLPPPYPLSLASISEEGSPSQVAAGAGVGNISSQFWEVIVRTIPMATSITSAEPTVLHMGLSLPRKPMAASVSWPPGLLSLPPPLPGTAICLEE